MREYRLLAEGGKDISLLNYEAIFFLFMKTIRDFRDLHPNFFGNTLLPLSLEADLCFDEEVTKTKELFQACGRVLSLFRLLDHIQDYPQEERDSLVFPDLSYRLYEWDISLSRANGQYLIDLSDGEFYLRTNLLSPGEVSRYFECYLQKDIGSMVYETDPDGIPLGGTVRFRIDITAENDPLA